MCAFKASALVGAQVREGRMASEWASASSVAARVDNLTAEAVLASKQQDAPLLTHDIWRASRPLALPMESCAGLLDDRRKTKVTLVASVPT
jgi:hypothetical protein